MGAERALSDCSSMSQRNIPEISISEQHDESDDKIRKKMSNKKKHSDSSWENYDKNGKDDLIDDLT